MRNGSSATIGSVGQRNFAQRNADHLGGGVVRNPCQHHRRKGQPHRPPVKCEPLTPRLPDAALLRVLDLRPLVTRLRPPPGSTTAALLLRLSKRLRLMRAKARRNKPHEELVIEKQNSQRQHQVIQERVVCRQNHANLPRRDDEKANQAHAPREKHHQHESEFHRQRSGRRSHLEPMRKMLHIPADPRGQRTILVVLVHGRQVAPFRVSARQLHHARFEVDAEPLPLQQEPACTQRRMVRAPSRQQAGRRK